MDQILIWLYSSQQDICGHLFPEYSVPTRVPQLLRALPHPSSSFNPANFLSLTLSSPLL